LVAGATRRFAGGEGFWWGSRRAVADEATSGMAEAGEHLGSTGEHLGSFVAESLGESFV
jgi:hypothetical protein